MVKQTHSQRTSVIITVFNEQDNILALLNALKNQTIPPSEVIITDGGSTDNTWGLLQDFARNWPLLRVHKVPGNRSVGRNAGVSFSRYPLIGFTDAGCIPQKNWLYELIKPFEDSAVNVVSGYYQGLAENNFQKALIPYVLVMPDVATKTEFLPSTRSMAIRKSSWQQSGGFDTKLYHNEDFAYAQWLKKLGFKFYFAQKAMVNWLPRKNLSQAAWMFFRFSLGDIQARIFRPKVKNLFIRYGLGTFAILYLHQLGSYGLIGIIVCIYLLLAILKNYRYVNNLSAIYWLPVIQLTSDFSVMFGTLVGLLSKAYGLF